MPMTDAEKLVHDIRRDPAFRTEAYECTDGISFQAFLISRGYVFNDHEWENALNAMRLSARDEEAACEITEIREWYRYMRGVI